MTEFQIVKRTDMEWPPIPTVESLSFFFAEAVSVGEKYVDPSKLRKLIDTASYCLEEVPANIAETVLYNLPTSRPSDHESWTGTFNELAAILRRPPVKAHEVHMAMAEMLNNAA